MKVFDAKLFGQEIRRRRKALGYTQTEVAQVCCVGVMFISELERGKETAQLGKAILVANMLGMDILLKDRGIA